MTLTIELYIRIYAVVGCILGGRRRLLYSGLDSKAYMYMARESDKKQHMFHQVHGGREAKSQSFVGTIIYGLY